MKKRMLKKLTSFMTAAFLAVSQFGITPEAWGVPSSEVKIPSAGFQLTLPPDLGTIQTLISGSGPTIVHVQTAHGNYEAQKKSQAILHYLKDSYGFNLLLLEGSASKLNPALLKFFPDRMDLTMEMAEELTKEALVKGDELFLLEEPEAQAYGIEDIPAYRTTREAFKSVVFQKEKTDQFLRDTNIQIERLTGPYLNKDLRSFLKRLEAFESKRISLLDWLAFLKDEAKRPLALDLTDPLSQFDWPMLVRIYKLREIETKIDLAAFAKERDEFLKALRRIPQETRQEIKRLLFSPLSQNQLPDPETGLLFERMVNSLPEGFDYDAYPNLKLFIAHLILQSEVKGEGLLEEMNRLTDQIQEKLAKTDEEKKIISLLKDYRLLERLFALELTPEDYDVIARKAEGPTKQSREIASGSFGSPPRNDSIAPSEVIQRFLELNTGKRVRNLNFSHVEDVDSLFEKALEFYQGVKARDQWMLRNIERILADKVQRTADSKKLNAERSTLSAVVITGGFHAGPFQDFFQKQGYNYALIAPKITSTEGRDAYLQVVLQNSSDPLKNSTMETFRLSDPARFQLGLDPAWAKERMRLVHQRILRQAKEPVQEGLPPIPISRAEVRQQTRELRGRPEGIELYESVFSKAKQTSIHIGSDIAHTAELQAAAIIRSIQQKQQKFDSEGERKLDVVVVFATGKTQWMGLTTMARYLNEWGEWDKKTREFLEANEVDLHQKPDMARVFASHLDAIFPQRRTNETGYFSYANELNHMFDKLGILSHKRLFFYGDIQDVGRGENILDSRINQLGEEDYQKVLGSVYQEGIQLNEFLAGSLDPHHPQYAYLDAMNRYAKAVSEKILALGGPDITIFSVGGSYEGKGHIAFNESGTDFNQGVYLSLLSYHGAAGNLMDNGGMSTWRTPEGKDKFAFVTLGPKELRSNPEPIYVMIITGKEKRESARRMLEKKMVLKVRRGGKKHVVYPAQVLQTGHTGSVVILEPSSASSLRLNTHPWDFREFSAKEWTEELKAKVFIQISRDTGKPIHKLTEDDYLDIKAGQRSNEILNLRTKNLKTLTRSERWKAIRKRVARTIQSNLMKPEEVAGRLGLKRNDTIVHIGPHLDDITLAAQFLVDKWSSPKGNQPAQQVFSYYTASGYTAVADTYMLDVLERMAQFSDGEIKHLADESSDEIKFRESEEKYLKQLVGLLWTKEPPTDPADYNVWRHLKPEEQELRAKILFLRINRRSSLHGILRRQKQLRAVYEVLHLYDEVKPEWGSSLLKLVYDIKVALRFTEEQTELMSRGVPYQNIFYPFESSWYGIEKKGTAKREDIDRIKEILRAHRPRMVVVNGEGFMDHGAHSITEMTVKVALMELMEQDKKEKIFPEGYWRDFKLFMYRGVWDRTEISGLPQQVIVGLTGKDLEDNKRSFSRNYVSQSPAPAPDASVEAPELFPDRVAHNAHDTYEEYRRITDDAKRLKLYQGLLAFNYVDELDNPKVEEAFLDSVRSTKVEFERVAPPIKQAALTEVNDGPPPYPDLSGEVGRKILSLLEEAGIPLETMFVWDGGQDIKKILGEPRLQRAHELEKTGLVQPLFPEAIEVGKGAALEVLERIKDQETAPLVVSSPHAIKALEAYCEECKAFLDDYREQERLIDVPSAIFRKDLEPLLESARASRPRVIVAIGRGSVMEWAKWIGRELNLEVIAIPTSLSTISPLGYKLQYRDDEGDDFKVKTITTGSAKKIIFDLGLLARDPDGIRAVLGDTLATFSALKDWYLSVSAGRDPPDEAVWNTAQKTLDALKENANIIASIAPESPEGVRTLIEILKPYVFNMVIAGSGRPASGSEHVLSTTVEKILHYYHLDQKTRILHGDLIFITTLLMAELQRQDREFLLELAHKLGLPTTPESIGLSRNILAQALLETEPRADRFTWFDQHRVTQEEAREAIETVFGRVRKKKFSARGVHTDLMLPYREVHYPDPSTQMMADALIDKLVPQLAVGSWIIELGSGSGPLAALMAAYSKRYRKGFRIIATDISPAAVKTTWDNLVFQYDLRDKATVIQSDLFESFRAPSDDPVLRKFLQDGGQAQVILFNPPIMPAWRKQVEDLLSEKILANYDYLLPDGAEFSDGLGIFRKFLVEAKPYVRPDGVIVVFLPAFLGKDKIEQAFRQAGFEPTILQAGPRLVRFQGVTWSQMELIEQISGYQFFNSAKMPYLNAKLAKASPGDIYYDALIYVAPLRRSEVRAAEPPGEARLSIHPEISPERRALIFGAGRVSLGYLAELWIRQNAGDVVFATRRPPMVASINRIQSYQVKPTGNQPVTVGPVSAISTHDLKTLSHYADHADWVFTTLGTDQLSQLASPLRALIEARAKSSRSDKPFNIIFAENFSMGQRHLKELKQAVLQGIEDSELRNFAEHKVGWIGAVVQPNVPDYPQDPSQSLDIVREGGNYELILDSQSYRGPPEIRDSLKGFRWVDDIESFRAEKFLIYNLGHATLAYLADEKGITDLSQAMRNPEIHKIVQQAMKESAEALPVQYPLLTPGELQAYVEESVKRFSRPELKDTVERVGREPVRKLRPTDRFLRAAQIAKESKAQSDPDYQPQAINLGIAAAIRYALRHGQMSEEELRTVLQSTRRMGLAIPWADATLILDVGGTNVRQAVIHNQAGSVVAEQSLPVNRTSREDIVSQLVEFIMRGFEKASQKNQKIDRVTITFPARFSKVEGKYVIVDRRTNLVGDWYHYPLEEEITKQLKESGFDLDEKGVSLRFMSDDRAAAEGELLLQGTVAQKGLEGKKILALTLGTGVGGILIVQSRVYLPNPYAGWVEDVIPKEVGSGDQTFFQLLSGSALGEWARQFAGEKWRKEEKLLFTKTPEEINEISGLSVTEALHQGNEEEKQVAQQLLEQLGRNLGLAVISLATGHASAGENIKRYPAEIVAQNLKEFQDIEAVVFGGGLSKGLAGEIIERSANQTLAEQGYSSIQVHRSVLEGRAGISGAVGLHLSEKPSPRAEVRKEVVGVSEKVEEFLTPRVITILSIRSWLVPLGWLVQYPGKFLRSVLIFVLGDRTAQAVLESERERFDRAKSIFGIGPRASHAYIFGPEFALDDGGLAFVRTVFGDSPAVVIVRNPEEEAFVQEYNQKLMEKNRPVILIAHDVQDAQAKLRDWIHELGGVKPGAFTPWGIVKSTEPLAVPLKQALHDNLTIVTTDVFNRFTEISGLDSLVSEFKARFQIQRSA